MSSAKLYGIYTANFPFLDTADSKIRPVIVVSSPQSKHNIIAIIPVSSRTKLENVDIALKDWGDEGLVKHSVARIHRLTTMLQADLVTELGALTKSDSSDLRAAIRMFLNLEPDLTRSQL